MKIKSVISTFFASLILATPTVAVAYAEDQPSKKTLSLTSVFDDLKDVDLTDVFSSEREDVSLYSFQEFGFPRYGEMKDYNLYFYVANPKKYKFKENDGASQINMAVKHNHLCEPVEFKNLRLRFLGYYDEDGASVNDRKIAKFCLVDPSEVFADQRDLENMGEERTYDIAGIQLRNESEYPIKVNLGEENTSTNIRDFDVSKTYTASGYAKGYGPEWDINKSTLQIRSKDLTTIKLDVRHTNFRPDNPVYNINGEYVYNDINSVYFSVDNEFFEDYGDLQKIKCEYYKYLTSPVFVVDETLDSNAYSALQPYIGKDMTENDYKSLNWVVAWGNIQVADNLDYINAYPKYYKKDVFCYENNRINRIDYLFKVKGDQIISRTKMTDYMSWYSSTIGGTKMQVGTKGYSRNLFVGENGNRYLMYNYKDYNYNDYGYKSETIDAGDTRNILSQSLDFWSSLGFTKPTTTVDDTYRPIQVLSKGDFKNENQWFENHFIAAYDKTEFTSYTNQALNTGKKVVLFRFDNSDYYQSLAQFDYLGNNNIFGLNSDIDGYVAQETTYLQFDVISLTFRGEYGAERVFGCVSDPVDIINPIEDKIGVPRGCQAPNVLPFILLLCLIILAYSIVKNVIRNKLISKSVSREMKKNKKRK